jgi:hypothetical protein
MCLKKHHRYIHPHPYIHIHTHYHTHTHTGASKITTSNYISSHTSTSTPSTTPTPIQVLQKSQPATTSFPIHPHPHPHPQPHPHPYRCFKSHAPCMLLGPSPSSRKGGIASPASGSPPCTRSPCVARARKIDKSSNQRGYQYAGLKFPTMHPLALRGTCT